MSDKPLVQQALAQDLGSLLLDLNTDSFLPFLEAFWEIHCSQWYGIDRIRWVTRVKKSVARLAHAVYIDWINTTCSCDVWFSLLSFIWPIKIGIKIWQKLTWPCYWKDHCSKCVVNEENGIMDTYYHKVLQIVANPTLFDITSLIFILRN